MRALIDTNLFISYALTPDGTGSIQTIFNALVDGQFTLLVPEALLDEIARTLEQKAHLYARINPEQARELVSLVKVLGEEIPRITQPLPAVTRDPKDDYLLAYALVGAADYLVTGDKDLLVLADQIQEIDIVTPSTFAALLRS